MQYELVELLELDVSIEKIIGLTIMDGGFSSILPRGEKGTFTLGHLPLTRRADRILRLSFNESKKFNQEMQNSFNNFFGKMKLIGKRYSYPMITTYTKKFISHRFAVVGDAAVGMHPVTAHGFNLGLKGLEILINEIKTAIKNKTDIGLTTVLQNYQFKLHRVAAPIYLATNGIVNLYTSTIFPAKLTRQFILRLVNIVKPVKRAFLSVLE